MKDRYDLRDWTVEDFIDYKEKNSCSDLYILEREMPNNWYYYLEKRTFNCLGGKADWETIRALSRNETENAIRAGIDFWTKPRNALCIRVKAGRS